MYKCKKCNHTTTISSEDHDYDLKLLCVVDSDGKFLGDITPNSITDMDALIQDLKEGGCPICDGWEDGMGNTCLTSGWGKNQRKGT